MMRGNLKLRREAAVYASILACGGENTFSEISQEAEALFWKTWHEMAQARPGAYTFIGDRAFENIWAEVGSVLLNGD